VSCHCATAQWRYKSPEIEFLRDDYLASLVLTLSMLVGSDIRRISSNGLESHDLFHQRVRPSWSGVRVWEVWYARYLTRTAGDLFP
jgi:hypothetical protein